jgi:hypothetical protein
MSKEIMSQGLFYSSNFDKYFTPEKAGWYVQYKTESGDSGAIRVERKPKDNADALSMLQDIEHHESWEVCFFDEVKEKQYNFRKFLVIGHARHGKDTFAEILEAEFGLKFESSSQSAANIFIYDELKDKYGYTTPEECFEDRVNHRAEWKTMICDYNSPDKAKLAKAILERSDCYVGMRDYEEIAECLRQDLFEIIIWVDASERLPLEDPSSFNIDKSVTHVIVDNNGTLEQFRERVIRMGKLLLK